MNLFKNHGRAALAVLFILTLAACGGGGGGGGNDSASTTVTCASGATAASKDACPAPVVLSIAPNDGATNIDPTTFSGITVETSDSLVQEVNATDNGRAVSGTTTLTQGGKGIVFVPKTALGYGEMHSFALVVTNTDGKSVTATVLLAMASAPVPTATLTASPSSITAGEKVTLTWSSTNAQSCTSSTFATGGASNGSVVVLPTANHSYTVTCSGSSLTVSAQANVTVSTVAWWPPAYIAPIGVKVTGPFVMPANCTHVSHKDACYQELVKNGSIKFSHSGVTVNGRPVVFGGPVQFILSASDTPYPGEYYNTFAVYADTGELLGGDLTSGGNNGFIDWAAGTSTGSIKHYSRGVNQGKCYEWYPYYEAGVLYGFAMRQVSCPF